MGEYAAVRLSWRSLRIGYLLKKQRRLNGSNGTGKILLLKKRLSQPVAVKELFFIWVKRVKGNKEVMLTLNLADVHPKEIRSYNTCPVCSDERHKRQEHKPWNAGAGISALKRLRYTLNDKNLRQTKYCLCSGQHHRSDRG